MKQKAIYWLPVLLWMTAIFIGSSISSVPQVGGRVVDGVLHRVAHVFEFTILGALLARALSRGRSITRRDLVSTLLITVLYGLSDEFHQRFTPGRNAELITVVWDAGGGLIGVVLWAWQLRRTRPHQATN